MGLMTFLKNAFLAGACFLGGFVVIVMASSMQSMVLMAVGGVLILCGFYFRSAPSH